MNAKEKAAGRQRGRQAGRQPEGQRVAFCFKCQANNRKEASLSRTQTIARWQSALQAGLHVVAVVVAIVVAFVVAVVVAVFCCYYVGGSGNGRVKTARSTGKYFAQLLLLLC